LTFKVTGLSFFEPIYLAKYWKIKQLLGCHHRRVVVLKNNNYAMR